MGSPAATMEKAKRNRPDPRTPVTLLTGFLGSGKTTLLNAALKDPAMGGVLVIINEFGEIGLDHLLVASSDDNILVLENGCLCCTVFGDLVGTLNQLYHSREAGQIAFDHVVIETSGLADPTPLVQAFLSEPTLEGLYRLASIVTVVDAVNGGQTLKAHDQSVRQVALADQILLTKLELAPGDRETAASELMSQLTRLNPAAQITAIDDPGVDRVAILRADGHDPRRGGEETAAWLNADAYEHSAGHAGHNHDPGAPCEEPGHHHGQRLGHAQDSAIVSFCFTRTEPTSHEALALLLSALERNLGPGLLRVKGLVNVAEEPGRPAVLQGAQHLLHNLVWLDRWPTDDHRTRIVFITEGMAQAALEEMIELLDRVSTRTATARSQAALFREGA